VPRRSPGSCARAARSGGWRSRSRGRRRRRRRMRSSCSREASANQDGQAAAPRNASSRRSICTVPGTRRTSCCPRATSTVSTRRRRCAPSPSIRACRHRRSHSRSTRPTRIRTCGSSTTSCAITTGSASCWSARRTTCAGRFWCGASRRPRSPSSRRRQRSVSSTITRAARRSSRSAASRRSTWRSSRIRGAGGCEMSGWRKLLTVSVPAALIAIVVAQTAIELWVRARWDPRRGRPGFFLSDPVRGQRLAANYDGWFAGVPVHTNSLELRDPREYSLEKGPNTFRILVLGDSVTFGPGSLYEHTYPFLLEQRLERWRPAVDWQVWNAAVPGYNTSQELAHLLEVGDRFRPDLVIVGFFENDLTDNAPIAHPGPVTVAAYRALSYARRHMYSLELYKQVYLTARWRLSGSDEYRRRVEHLGTEEGLLARASDATVLREQQLTAFDRFTDDEVAQNRCVYGMKENPAAVAALERDPRFPRWIDAVRGFQ